MAVENVENGACKEQNKSCDNCTVPPKKGSLKKHKSSNADHEPEKARNLKIDERNNNDEYRPNTTR